MFIFCSFIKDSLKRNWLFLKTTVSSLVLLP